VLEVVIALAILALATGMVTAALGGLQGMRARAEHKLAAAEAAHRVILQFNDDPRSVQRADAPIEVNGYVFDFQIRQSVLRIDEFTGTARIEPTTATFGDISVREQIQNRLWRVEVDVLAREPGYGFQPGDVVASMNRVYDYLADPDRLFDVISDMFGEQLDNR
jgi:type II secretory pathway component PulJ